MSKEPSALCVTLLCLKTIWGCEQIVRFKISLLFSITWDTLYTLSKSVPKCFGSLSMLLDSYFDGCMHTFLFDVFSIVYEICLFHFN